MDPQDTQRAKPGIFTDSTNVLLIGIVVIIAILMGGISFLILRANKTTPKTTRSTTQRTQAPITISHTWKTYKSIFGISVDYPDNLTPLEDATKQTINFTIPSTHTSFMNIAVISVPFTNSPTGNRTVEGINFISQWKEITVNGVTGHRFVKNPCPKECPSLAVDFPYKNSTAILSITSVTPDVSLFDEIVKRIKFTP
jgi:hypothetical protein